MPCACVHKHTHTCRLLSLLGCTGGSQWSHCQYSLSTCMQTLNEILVMYKDEIEQVISLIGKRWWWFIMGSAFIIQKCKTCLFFFYFSESHKFGCTINNSRQKTVQYKVDECQAVWKNESENANVWGKMHTIAPVWIGWEGVIHHRLSICSLLFKTSAYPSFHHVFAPPTCISDVKVFFFLIQ